MLLKREDIQSAVGKHIGTSPWFEVTQKDVDLFADVTHDRQFIHIDPVEAAKTPFGGTIAHGFFTMSMLSYFSNNGCGIDIEGSKMGVNYGCDKLRFLKPVRVGSRIRGNSDLISAIEKRPNEFLFKSRMVVEIEDSDTPALVAEWLGMVVI